MGESIKAILALLLIVSLMVLAFALIDDRPDASTWITIGASLLVGAGCGAMLLKLQFRKDVVPDFLKQQAGNYFNRNGFCFAPVAAQQDGLCLLTMWFQNQRDRPSVGRIAIRPAKGFWLNRAKIDWMTFEIECEPGAFGLAVMPMAVPLERQGKKQTFEIGASVEYPEGKGKRLRFHDGLFLRTNAKFGRGLHTALAIGGVLGGGIVISRPATMTFVLPVDVADELPRMFVPEVETHWKLGDPVPDEGDSAA